MMAVLSPQAEEHRGLAFLLLLEEYMGAELLDRALLSMAEHLKIITVKYCLLQSNYHTQVEYWRLMVMVKHTFKNVNCIPLNTFKIFRITGYHL